eukprot:796647_1
MTQTLALIDNLISTFREVKPFSSQKISKKQTELAANFAQLQQIDHCLAEKALLWKYDTTIIPTETEYVIFGYIRNMNFSYHISHDLILECIRFYNIGSLR